MFDLSVRFVRRKLVSMSLHGRHAENVRSDLAIGNRNRA
jgi:hypothetical protein